MPLTLPAAAALLPARPPAACPPACRLPSYRRRVLEVCDRVKGALGPDTDCSITSAPPDSLAAAGANASSAVLRRKACKDVTSSERAAAAAAAAAADVALRTACRRVYAQLSVVQFSLLTGVVICLPYLMLLQHRTCGAYWAAGSTCPRLSGSPASAWTPPS